MFHLAAYTSASTLAASPNAMTGLVDPVLTRSATSALYILAKRMQLMWALGISASIARVQLTSPTLRQVNSPYMRPINLGAAPVAGVEVAWYGDQPLNLPALEELGPLISVTAAGPEQSFLLLAMTEGTTPAPAGPVLTARATATFAAVANTWTLGTFTLESALPSGMYALVGSEHISATGIAHRFAIPGQVQRPGSVSQSANGRITDWRLLSRRMGVFGTFLNTAPPQLEVLCTAADAAHELWLQLIPISGQIVP
jgi:hypothetical protein